MLVNAYVSNNNDLIISIFKYFYIKIIIIIFFDCYNDGFN